MTAEPYSGPAGSSSPAAVPGREPDLYVLTVSHQYGDVVTVHHTEPEARGAAAGYAREYWHEIAGSEPAGQRQVPDTPDGLDDDTVIRVYFSQHADDESYRISPAFLPPAPVPGQFRLDEEKARAFLARALRRWAGTLAPGEGPGAGTGEDWRLPPGWNPRAIFADDTGTVEDLVHQAVYEAGALARPSDTVDLDLSIQSPIGGEWSYDWRVSFSAAAGFALCAPCSEEYRRLGGFEEDGDPRTSGARAALGILREAEARGNALLAAHASGHGRVPAARPRAVPGALRPGPGSSPPGRGK